MLGVLTRSRLLALLRPDKYIKMAAAVRPEGLSVATGFAIAAARCPDRPGLIDELGILTWKELHDRCNALAAALERLPEGSPQRVGIMCRNHRGFVEALCAAFKVGADVVLLNTSFAGPALAEVVTREGIDTMIYDEEFTESVGRASTDKPPARRVVAWVEDPGAHEVTIEALISEFRGRRPKPPMRKSHLIMLTSGTTGTPKGTTHSGGGPKELTVILDRTPWRAEETTVVVAPMFHAWGFSQLIFSAMMACTVVTRRKFDPEATLQLVDRHQATGLCVVPVMFDRIMALPDAVRAKYSGRSLRFAAASGSRMRPDVVTSFMDEFGDIIYNNYNATEAGMIALATPADLRYAPNSAGKPVSGTQIRILDAAHQEVPTRGTGQIFVYNSMLFDGYTEGTTKPFCDGFMASGDLGYFDDTGRLFVVGRDDEMIVSGGENVYPIEVEKLLMAHDDVVEASVIGADDDAYGQRLAAFVVLTAGATATADTLKQHVRQNLANYKVPRDITVLEELPRNSTGKILRSELRDRVVAVSDDAGHG
jgi:acyl-CoA synthetase (AMP-forming)/AMP-acid ligase II